MVYFVTTGEMHGFSHQNPLCELSGCFSTVLFFLLVPKSIASLKEKTGKTNKVNSSPGMLEFKAKYIERRRRNGCNFIKNKEYKYILGKTMPPYTTLSLFLIISSKNYISHPKTLTKSAATVVFVRKVSQGCSFKKDTQFNSNFSIGMWCCGCATSQTLLSYLSNCHYSQR